MKVRPTSEVVKIGETDHIVLEVVEGEYKGCKFYYLGMKMADHENEDGSMNMSFDYEITNNFEVKNLDHFGNFLGDTLLSILEEQMKKNEVVYKGGV